MHKRADLLECRDGIVVEEEMGRRWNFDHVNVATAKSW
jgi:hypothetical protein